MFKLFKKSKAARKYLSQILLNIHAVDNKLKPCYLWDLFYADSDEIQHYLDKLKTLGETNSRLTVFTVNDTHFVTEKYFLIDYFKVLTFDSAKVVDVSIEDNPCVLSEDGKKTALEPLFNWVTELLTKIESDCELGVIPVDTTFCNLSTLYGMLVGYPVLYWYENPEKIGGSCLSMVPIVNYNVACYNKAITARTETKMKNFNTHKQTDNFIYSFSVPESLLKDTEIFINNWFTQLKSNSKNSMLCDLRLSQETRCLPCVSL